MTTITAPFLINHQNFGVPTLSRGGAIGGPFYFAWVNSNETTFGPQHHVMDEYIFSVERVLAEGEKPLLRLQIENPRVGLLNAGRKVWAWFSWNNTPLFFGRLVGSPTQLTAEIVQIELIADPVDYKHQRQILAESMKVLPYWDPVWIEIGKRDDPDKILEAYGALWNVDPVTHEVTAVG